MPIIAVGIYKGKLRKTIRFSILQSQYHQAHIFTDDCLDKENYCLQTATRIDFRNAFVSVDHMDSWKSRMPKDNLLMKAYGFSMEAGRYFNRAKDCVQIMWLEEEGREGRGDKQIRAKCMLEWRWVSNAFAPILIFRKDNTRDTKPE